MASGIEVTDDVVQTYNEIKLGRKYRYVIFKISDDYTQVVQEKTGPTSETYEDFVGCLPSDECRYAIVDYDYKTADGRQSSKILFVVWAPDNAPIKAKMLITSTKDAVKKQLVGIGVEVQATDFSEISEEAFADKLN
jgi:cofilin